MKNTYIDNAGVYAVITEYLIFLLLLFLSEMEI